MSARAILLAASLIGLGSTIAAGDSRAVDLFHTQRAIPATAASPILAGHAICSFGALSNPLTLREAVERALCTSPDTRKAWTIIEERAAAVGISKAVYLPTLTATGQLVHDDSVTNVRDHASLSSNYSTIVQSDSLQLGWVLYDFGGRRAALKNAKALLSAAQANEDAALQQTFSDTAKAYYAAQAAIEQLAADAAIAADARDSSIAAQERITRGAAPSTEGYQALTAYEQALVTQTKDRGLAAAASGTLANTMGLSPDTALMLESVDQSQLPNKGFNDTVAALIQHAERTHPAVLAAEKEVEASQAAIVQAKAQGRPTVKLVGDYSRNNEPVQLGLGLPHYPATGHDGYVGFQVSIPLFSGFATHY